MLKIIPQKKKSTIAVEDRKRLVLYEQIEKKNQNQTYKQTLKIKKISNLIDVQEQKKTFTNCWTLGARFKMHAILVKFGQNWPKFGQKGDQNYICMDKILNEEKGNRKKH